MYLCLKIQQHFHLSLKKNDQCFCTNMGGKKIMILIIYAYFFVNAPFESDNCGKGVCGGD